MMLILMFDDDDELVFLTSFNVCMLHVQCAYIEQNFKLHLDAFAI